MVNRILKLLGSLAFVFLLVASVSASIIISQTGNHEIASTYSKSNQISGWINVSFKNEPATTLVTGKFGTSAGKSIRLIDLLNKSSNANYAYTCDIKGCRTSYSSDGGAMSSASISFEAKETKIIGINISGPEINTISKFSVNLTTDATESTNISSLTIDVLNDNSLEWQAHISAEEFNQMKNGCYTASGAEEAEIPTDNTYCERVTLERAPAVKIGANVIGDAGTFTLSIEDAGGDNYETCHAESTGTGEISCDVEDFPISEAGNYFVCIKAGEAGHKINYNSNHQSPCGFSGAFSGKYDADYNLFAKTKKYAPVKDIVLNESESETAMGYPTDIELSIEDYIEERYGSNCTRGCFVPIKIRSEINQKVDVSKVRFNYQRKETLLSGEFNLFNLTEVSGKVTSTAKQKLYLDEAGFSVPSTLGSHTFSLLMGSAGVFSEKINVTQGPEIQYITPTKTGVNYSTEFTVTIGGESTAVKYTWQFGDGVIENTTINTANHKYLAVGNYSMKVTTFDSTGKSSFHTFDVKVYPVSTIINQVFADTKNNVAILQSTIASEEFSLFEQKAINYSLNLTQMNNILAGINTRLAASTTEAEYGLIFDSLMKLNIPEYLTKTGEGEDLLFYSDQSAVDLNVLKTIGGGTYSSSEETAYKGAISMWEVENIGTNITFGEISAQRNNRTTPFLRTFEVEIKSKSTDASYIILRKMQNMMLDEGQQMQTSGNYYYTLLNNSVKKIKFSTTENFSFDKLPLFVSPAITKISIMESEVILPAEEGKGKVVITNPGLFWTMVISVIVIAIGIWIALQIWYAKRYEHYLFKNKENLYNLVNYIAAEKSRGTAEKELIEKLKTVGWTQEQINYVIKKYIKKRKEQPKTQ